MLGNLAMFVITFVIGIKTILKKSMTQQETIQQAEDITEQENNATKENIQQDEDSINSQLPRNQEQNKVLQDIIHEENSTEEENNNGTQNEMSQEIIQKQDFKENHNAYIGIGILGISVMFLIITIIFFIKYQLKMKNGLSK